MNIHDTPSLQNILSKLDPAATPLWGKMSPQHIVEHLTTSVKISTGKNPVKLYLTDEEADKIKSKIVYSEAALTPGIKNPILGDEPPPLRHSNIQEAMKELFDEIEYFDQYYKANPDAKNTHPRMGELTQTEWLTVHSKHFTHHFKQYGLLQEHSLTIKLKHLNT